MKHMTIEMNIYTYVCICLRLGLSFALKHKRLRRQTSQGNGINDIISIAFIVSDYVNECLLAYRGIRYVLRISLGAAMIHRCCGHNCWQLKHQDLESVRSEERKNTTLSLWTFPHELILTHYEQRTRVFE